MDIKNWWQILAILTFGLGTWNIWQYFYASESLIDVFLGFSNYVLAVFWWYMALKKE